MALPGDHEIKLALMSLLLNRPDGRMYSGDVYGALAERFPLLTRDETNIPYQNSVSHWANRVQFAVLHLRREGWLLPVPLAGHGWLGSD